MVQFNKNKKNCYCYYCFILGFNCYIKYEKEKLNLENITQNIYYVLLFLLEI